MTTLEILRLRQAALRVRLIADEVGAAEPMRHGDAADQAVRRGGLEQSFTERELLLEQMRAIDRALDRLAEGTYGMCEACGEAIAALRLQAIPEAALCRGCQAEAERRARVVRVRIADEPEDEEEA